MIRLKGLEGSLLMTKICRSFKKREEPKSIKSSMSCSQEVIPRIYLISWSLIHGPPRNSMVSNFLGRFVKGFFREHALGPKTGMC